MLVATLGDEDASVREAARAALAALGRRGLTRIAAFVAAEGEEAGSALLRAP